MFGSEIDVVGEEGLGVFGAERSGEVERLGVFGCGFRAVVWRGS